MKCVEIFSGAGGLAIGLNKAGFKPIALIEQNSHACRTIRENQRTRNSFLSNSPVHQIDVKNFNFKNIDERVDLLAGGPPCQPFSRGGQHLGHRDARNLFPEMIRAIRDLSPRAVLIENVKGLVRGPFLNYFKYILLQLQYPDFVRRESESWIAHAYRLSNISASQNEAPKYAVHFKILNAADYGVPQKRERVMIVCFRADVRTEWNFPEATHSKEALLFDQWISGHYWKRHQIRTARILKPRVDSIRKGLDMRKVDLKPWRTIRDAFEGLPNPRENSHGISNHEFRAGARVYHGHTGSHIDEPAKTLKAGNHGVPGGENIVQLSNGRVRYFTVRESARIQTFPDEYKFFGSWGESMRQIGNAVPVDLAFIMGKSISKILSKEKEITAEVSKIRRQRESIGESPTISA